MQFKLKFFACKIYMNFKNSLEHLFFQQIDTSFIKKLCIELEKSKRNITLFHKYISDFKIKLISVFNSLKSIDDQLLLLKLFYKFVPSSFASKNKLFYPYDKEYLKISESNIEQMGKEFLIIINSANSNVLGFKCLSVEFDGILEESASYYCFLNEFEIKVYAQKVYCIMYRSVDKCVLKVNCISLCVKSKIFVIVPLNIDLNKIIEWIKYKNEYCQIEKDAENEIDIRQQILVNEKNNTSKIEKEDILQMKIDNINIKTPISDKKNIDKILVENSKKNNNNNRIRINEKAENDENLPITDKINKEIKEKIDISRNIKLHVLGNINGIKTPNLYDLSFFDIDSDTDQVCSITKKELLSSNNIVQNCNATNNTIFDTSEGFSSLKHEKEDKSTLMSVSVSNEKNISTEHYSISSNSVKNMNFFDQFTFSIDRSDEDQQKTNSTKHKMLKNKSHKKTKKTYSIISKKYTTGLNNHKYEKIIKNVTSLKSNLLSEMIHAYLSKYKIKLRSCVTILKKELKKIQKLQ